MAENNKLLGSTIDSMFSKNRTAVKQETARPKKPADDGVTKHDLELAVTVLLVDLASSDQNFEQREYYIISAALKSLFGTGRDQVQALVNQANIVLKNLRGTSQFAHLLREHLDDKSKKAFMELIQEMIGADGVEDGFEIYLRNKIAAALGIQLVVTPEA